MQVSFRFHSLRCSEILVSPSICTKIWTWRFHRSGKISNNFPVSWHITHISMTISANLGRDTDHNSTKLVCDHPLIQICIFTSTDVHVWYQHVDQSFNDVTNRILDVYTFVSIDIFAHVHIYISIFQYVYKYMHTHVCVNAYVYIYLYIYICLYIHVYIYTYVHRDIYICIYIHICKYISIPVYIVYI